MSKLASGSSATSSVAARHRDWRNRHAAQMHETKASEDVLDEFIASQKASGTACSARLLESKRALDGLISEIKTLSSQVDSHEEVLETETENLHITKMSIEAVEEMHKEEIAECESDRKVALEDVAQYTAELTEMEQIAKPKIRFEHVHTVDIAKPSAQANLGLLENSAWSRQSCLAFVDFAHRRQHRHHRHQQRLRESPPVENSDAGKPAPTAQAPEASDCDSKRSSLQDAFTKAYKELSDLLQDAKERSVDTFCHDTADTEKAAALVPMVGEREQASARIEYAEQAMATLAPVLDLVKERAEKLGEHIESALTPECEEAGEVSKVLANIRELIMDLEECPGRNDFALKIPEVTAAADSAATEDASEEEDATNTNNDEDAGETEEEHAAHTNNAEHAGETEEEHAAHTNNDQHAGETEEEHAAHTNNAEHPGETEEEHDAHTTNNKNNNPNHNNNNNNNHNNIDHAGEAA